MLRLTSPPAGARAGSNRSTSPDGGEGSGGAASEGFDPAQPATTRTRRASGVAAACLRIRPPHEWSHGDLISTMQPVLTCGTSHCRAVSDGLPTRQVGTEDEPHPAVDPMPTPRGLASVVLAGRATTVPFTTDVSGRKRTPTNPTATMTCAVRRLARWQPRPIWLWEQGVGWVRLASALPYPAGRPRSLVAEDRSARGVRDRTGPDSPRSRSCSRDLTRDARDEVTQDGMTPQYPASSTAW